VAGINPGWSGVAPPGLPPERIAAEIDRLCRNCVSVLRAFGPRRCRRQGQGRRSGVRDSQEFGGGAAMWDKIGACQMSDSGSRILWSSIQSVYYRSRVYSVGKISSLCNLQGVG
jgi:hypothetical protein